MKLTSIVDYAHLIIKEHINKDDIIVDATAGRGLDTLFLANLVKHVFAFDIQDDALKSTKELLDNNGVNNVTLIKDSYENIYQYVSDFKGVIFNLGYLPNGDKTITTHPNITLSTVHMLVNKLVDLMFILIVVYPGHKAGLIESILLTDYLKDVDPTKFSILKVDLPFQTNRPPYIYFIKRKNELL